MNFRPPTHFLEAMRVVVAQSDLKRKLAYAFSRYTLFLDDERAGKALPLIFGPSGSGKTHSIEICAQASGLPTTSIGGAGISAAGYKGVTMRDLLTQHYVRHRTSHGVIFIDEIDKWCKGAIALDGQKPDPEQVQMAISKQAELLRYVEREDVWFIEEAKDLGALREHDEDALDPEDETAWKPTVFETRRAFWVLAGAFGGLQHVIRQRLQQDNQVDEALLWEKAAPEDFRRYGMQQELVNRCSVVAWVKPLRGTEMIEIMEQQELPRYRLMFEALGCRLDLQTTALAAVSELAVRERTGARGAALRLAHVMSDVFTEADERRLASCCVDARVMLSGHLDVSPQDHAPALQPPQGTLPLRPVAAV